MNDLATISSIFNVDRHHGSVDFLGNFAAEPYSPTPRSWSDLNGHQIQTLLKGYGPGAVTFCDSGNQTCSWRRACVADKSRLDRSVDRGNRSSTVHPGDLGYSQNGSD